MERYANQAITNVGAVINGIFDQCDFTGADLSGREMSGLFMYCDFTGATMHGMTTRIPTLFFECKGLPVWLKRPSIGAKNGDLWSEHGRVQR